jgi:probable F420-dependent oxidoreductase
VGIDVGYGLITCERHPDREADWPELYRESLELTRRAEALGLASVWTTEHHFVDSGYLPAPLVLSAAMAAVSERIRIGTGVILAPLYHPLWIAEEAAVVDNLADGRLILGLGLGWSATEFTAFGADLATRGRWMDEVLDILDQAGRDDVVRHHGPLVDLPEVAVRPRPARGRLTTWIGGHADAALRRAARLADGVLLSNDLEGFRREVGVIREELDRIGRDPATFEIGVYLTVVPDEGDRDAWDEIGPAVLHADWKYGDMEASATRTGAPIPRTGRLTEAEVAETRRYCLTGPAEAVAGRVAAYGEAAGGRLHLVARNYLPGIPAAGQVELLERVAREVVPLLG